jgi:organic radical activating enzyme
METFRVGLILTERCDAECSHCWFSSGPIRTRSMTPHEARGYIDQAAEVSTVKWISFTGGEPFLMPEALVELVGYASERGFNVECATNCSWATSKEQAERRLGELADSGLDTVNISSDDFHQRHIPFERVRHCYEASKEVGLKAVIMCASSRSNALGIDEIKLRLRDEGIHDIRAGRPTSPVSALAVESGFIPVGRAASIPEEERLIGDGPLDGPCDEMLRDIGIAPSGRVLPCCSAASLVDHAHLGDAKTQRLPQLLSNARVDPLFEILSSEGPRGLDTLIDGSRGDRYVNRCHLCHDVLSDPRLPKAIEKQEY